MPLLDHPDFQKITWPQRDWAAYEEFFKIFHYYSTTPLNAGSELKVDTYTVPAGKKLYCTNFYHSTQFRGKVWFDVPAIPMMQIAWFEQFITTGCCWDVPCVYSAGLTVDIYIKNEDIVSGHWTFGSVGYELPASKPKNPKNNTSEELYRCGEFNYCTTFVLLNNERVRIFGKVREKTRNYLRLKGFKPKEEIISQFHLIPEEVDKIMKIIREEPEEVLLALNKLEK